MYFLIRHNHFVIYKIKVGSPVGQNMYFTYYILLGFPGQQFFGNLMGTSNVSLEEVHFGFV